MSATELHPDSLFAADMAFLDMQKQGGTTAQCVHLAIRAYIEDRAPRRPDCLADATAVVVEQEDPNDDRSLVAYVLTGDRDDARPLAMLCDDGDSSAFLTLLIAGATALGLDFEVDERSRA